MKDWSTDLDSITNDFENHFSDLTFDQLNWKSGSDTWSIAQNVEHLIIINESYYPIFEKLKNGKYRTPLFGRWSWFANYIGTSILKSVQPDNPKRVKTFPTWRPSKSEISADIIQKFIEHQSDLKKRISDIDGPRSKGVIIHSPVNKNIVYPLEMALEILVTHERRHLNQALGVKSGLSL